MHRSLGRLLRKALRRVRPPSDTQLVSVADQLVEQDHDLGIPPIVFQTAESRLVHPSHAKAIRAFREINPSLSFVLFDGRERDEYMMKSWSGHPILDVYKRAKFGQMRADIFRYCIVYQRGGYYFDFNKGCQVSLRSLHPPEALGLVTYESNPSLLFPSPPQASNISNPFNLVAQWGFGFSARHELLRMAIERIVEIEPFFRDRRFKRPKEALLTMSAPGLFTYVFREYAAQFGLADIVEAGEDFNGFGLFRLRGSMKLQSRETYYGQQKDQEIVSSGGDSDKATNQ